MKRILREPLLHFLLVGALLFFAYDWLHKEEEENKIVIDEAVVDELISRWELINGKNTGQLDLKYLVKEYIELEVLYREALAMNLDANDEIIKQRLSQKMIMLSEDLADSPLSDENLQAYFEQNKESYRKASVYTFEQVFFDERKRDNGYKDAINALATVSPSSLGDDTRRYERVKGDELVKEFGLLFVNEIDSLKVNEWSKPINSVFGVHLVKIHDKVSDGYYSFNEVKGKVMEDYNTFITNYYKKEFVAFLLRDYVIDIDLKDVELKKELDETF